MARISNKLPPPDAVHFSLFADVSSSFFLRTLVCFFRAQHHSFLALFIVTPFYLATLASVTLGVLLLNFFIPTTTEVQAILNIALATICVVALINLKIKVSIHALISCTFALVMPHYLPAPLVTFPLFITMWALTVWSRKALKRHSTPELVLGTITGVLVSEIYLFII